LPFPTPSSGRQFQPSHRCPVLVCRCARALRWSSTSHHHQSPLSTASATVAGVAAAAAIAVARSWPSVSDRATGPPCGRGASSWAERRATVQLGHCMESARWPVESFSYFLNKFKTLQTSKIYTSLNPSQKNVKQFFCWIDLVLF
jgi:hypothetical protein